MSLDELVGFVTGNKRREQVIQVLEGGPASVERVAKSVRIPSQVINRILDDMAEKGLIEKVGDTWRLTDTGAEVEARLRAL